MGLATVDAYLASLPGGIDAYPECAHKGDALAVWLRASPTAGLAERVPPVVARLVTDESAITTWVPEVHANVLYVAIRECSFRDDESFLVHAHACNEAVLQTPLNRVVFWVAAPKAILRAAGLRWGSIHRGSTLEVSVARDTYAHCVLRYPPNLFPAIVLRGLATAFAAALENAGGRDVRVELRDAGAAVALFDARWS
jgi:hypothetical protein